MNGVEDMEDRINLHALVTLPDWLDTDPPRIELEAVMTWHIAVLAATENCIRQIELKLAVL